MGTWEIIPNDGVTATTIEGDNFNVLFGNRSNLQSQTYTIKYTDGDYCGQTTVTQPGGAQPPVGDCESGRMWTPDYLMNTPLNTIYSTALQCCDDTTTTTWRANGGITVKIVNNSNYYIPFNGEIKRKATPDVKHYFRLETSAGHFRYGKEVLTGHDTNFFVPPHATATLTKCLENSLVQEGGIYHFYISVLCSTAPDADKDHIEGYVLHNEDISFENECTSSVNGNTLTFTIPNFAVNTTRWRADNLVPWPGQIGKFNYALTLDEIIGEHCSRFNYTANGDGKVRIVPVYINSNANWSAIETALTTYNSNRYYPYTIEPNP